MINLYAYNVMTMKMRRNKMMFFYAIAMGTFYLLFCSYMNYIMEKREIELKNKILFNSFKYRK